MGKRIKFTPEHEKLEELVRQAWTLTQDEIDSIQPGNFEQALSLIDTELTYRPFTDRSQFDIENPDIHLLKVMRDPEFFPFTCRTLFGKPDGSGPLEIAPFQHLILRELWYRQFPMLIGSRGLGKSFTLALYILLRLIFTPGAKVVIVASAFRQAKVVFEYMERIWFSSPILRDLVGDKTRGNSRDNGPRRDIDRCEFLIGESVAIALPLGDGKKIRGLRANYIIAEEFASIPEEIYSIVVQGFGAVTADPVQNMKDFAAIRLRKRLGLWTEEMDVEEAKKNRGNQSVLSGTAYYSFNHFCKFWREYRDIINTRGDKKKLEEVLKGSADEFNYRDYSIIRIPYDMIPKGYMDDKTVARARQITHSSHYLMEYGACFANDSEGFFKMSLINRCVVGNTDDPNPPVFQSCGLVQFGATLAGDPRRRYVYGVDPASESDRFALVITEIWPDHRRVVFTWTTGKSDHRQKLKDKRVEEHDFYRYCVRKIRDLMKVFPCERMLVDAGGGGIALREAFRDPDKREDGEMPIYEVIDPDPKKHRDEDDMQGHHILEMVQFRDNAWVTMANEGLKKDLEDRVLLFPQIDPLAIGMAMEDDKENGRIVMGEDGNEVFQIADTLESNMLEIEALKEELSTIVISETPSGLRHWDTPDKKVAGATKGKMRKDRYSALLMSNMGARIISATNPGVVYEGVNGGFANALGSGQERRKKMEEPMYRGGPAWWQEGFKKLGSSGYGAVVRKNGVNS